MYFETGSRYISAANGDISTKFGLLIDSDLLEAVTSTYTKPEVVFSGCGENITRGHPFKFRVQQYRIDARKKFFSSRVVTIMEPVAGRDF